MTSESGSETDKRLWGGKNRSRETERVTVMVSKVNVYFPDSYKIWANYGGFIWIYLLSELSLGIGPFLYLFFFEIEDRTTFDSLNISIQLHVKFWAKLNPLLWKCPVILICNLLEPWCLSKLSEYTAKLDRLKRREYVNHFEYFSRFLTGYQIFICF